MFRPLLLEITSGLLFLIPVALVLWTLVHERRIRETEYNDPFPDLLRRPAGESTRLEVEKLNEKITEWLFLLAFVPVSFALCVAFQPGSVFVLAFLGFFGVTIVAAIALRKLRPLLNSRSHYYLGYQGERYVAEELNQLMRDGFDVFHDVPFDNFNIDHVLLGERGVFVVETKTRRKPAQKGGPTLKVIFDGKVLHFPNCNDSKSVEQTLRNARTLSRQLSDATGMKFFVQGILTLPGWWVESSVPKAEIQVLNPKLIRRLVCDTPHTLNRESVQRAKYQLEQWCKLPAS
jgi:hypothetical protein